MSIAARLGGRHCPYDRAAELDAEHCQCTFAILCQHFPHIHSAEFGHLDGVTRGPHARTIDLHALYERAQEDSLRIGRHSWRCRYSRVNCHFAEFRIPVKLFFQLFERVAAKKQVAFEFELNRASADSEVLDCTAK